jgi:alpha-1,2-mannosyltransferase
VTTLAPAKTPWQRWAAWGFCLLIFVIIVGDVVLHSDKHNTTPTYRAASTAWWEGIDPYNGDEHSGFFYFPQAAFLFTPFNVMPFMAGEVLWRVFTFGLFVYALMRLNAYFLTAKNQSPGRTFLILVLLSVPSAFASLRNAQFDLPLAALIVLSTAEIAAGHWSTAALWICLAVALKPLAVVPLLLFGALYWRLIPRLVVGMLVVIALPFLHWNPAFVAHEYVRCYESLTQASKADEPRYSDLGALLSHFHYNAPQTLKTAARLLAAIAYLGLGAMAVRRQSIVASAWAVGALAADYLMLFNPRTETCSYVFLGPFVASLGIYLAAQPGRKALGRAIGFAALGFACDAFPKLGSFSIHDLTDRWFKPLLALLFLPVLVWFILKTRTAKANL